MKRIEKREHLIEVATTLFNRLGYRATGIDHVIAEAGIAKTTLYRHFCSKEDLIVAVLQRLDARFRAGMREMVDGSADAPADKIFATFDFLDSWFRDETFYGCPFVSAAGEYCDRDSRVFQVAAAHKQAMVDYLEELARAAEVENPRQLADEINLLHEGATAVAHVVRDPSAAHNAKAMAARLLNEASAV